MKRFLLIIITSLMVVNNFTAGQTEDSGWRKISEDEDRIIYYNSKNIIKTRNDTLKVWIRVEPSSKSAKEKYEKSRKDDWPKHHAKYAFTAILQEYDCVERRHRILTGIDYAEDMKSLADVKPQSLSDILWKDIVPDTLGDEILKAVCSQSK